MNLYSNKLPLNSFLNTRKWIRMRKGPQLYWGPGEDSCQQLVSLKPNDLPSPSSSLSSGLQDRAAICQSGINVV